MKTWFREHKWKILFSLLVTLMPILAGILLWDRLPEILTTHWGGDGNADGFQKKEVAVFALPAVLCIVNLACLAITAYDNRNTTQNKKAVGIVFWVVPVISVMTNGFMYATALGKHIDASAIMPILMGVVFLCLGNYMPKIKQNRTIGIKLPWTLSNEENWNKTHRLAGKVWVCGGILMLISVFLPASWMLGVLLAVSALCVLIPSVYSYRIYRVHQQEGVVYDNKPKSKREAIARKISFVAMLLVLVAICIIMFTGDITYDVREDSMKIQTAYWADLVVEYTFDSVEYREDFTAGSRVNGFGSAKLSLGTFENDEFGRYTLYAYTCCDAVVVLKHKGEVLVLGAQNVEETLSLYNALIEKLPE